MTILWPERTATGRLIPLLANSIRVQIHDSSNVLRATQVIARPSTDTTSTASFPLLPTGTLSVSATAYPNSDGTGIPLARGGGELVVRAAENSTVRLTMQSTITELELIATPNPLKLGQVAALSLHARDSSGNIVLTSPTNWKFSSLKPHIARLLANGNELEAMNAGTTFVMAREEESGRSVQTTVTVEPQVEYRIVPILLPATAIMINVRRVNNQGWVAGSLQLSDGSVSLFLWKLRADQSGGDFVPFAPYPGMQRTQIEAISNTGVVLGYATNGSTIVNFLWENGIYTALPAEVRSVSDINDSGQIVGYGTESFINYPLMVQGSTVTRLPLTGQAVASGINRDGTIVGSSFDGSYNRGYRYQNSSFSFLQPPTSFTNFQAEKINTRGSVLGTCYGNSSGKHSPGLATEGSVIALPTPEGSGSAVATNIGDNDLVVGYAASGGAIEYAVRWRNGVAQDINRV